MQTPVSVVGIDVSKATLAVCYQPSASPEHLQVPNTPAGFRHLVRHCGIQRLYVLEATGTYYLALTYHLVAAGAQVAVLNPLVVERIKKCGAVKLNSSHQPFSLPSSGYCPALFDALNSRQVVEKLVMKMLNQLRESA